jgi:hypothetical protein
MITPREARQKIKDTQDDRRRIWLNEAETAIKKAAAHGFYYATVVCDLPTRDINFVTAKLTEVGYTVENRGEYMEGGCKLCIGWVGDEYDNN